MYKHIILRDNSVTKISTSAQMTGLQMAVPLQVRWLHFGDFDITNTYTYSYIMPVQYDIKCSICSIIY